ncbi:MAG: hypothetical protein CL608_18550 [Anaerolineaceae bacterium]|nr:hypothetical protein [Anaerolineaceae bacterium]
MVLVAQNLRLGDDPITKFRSANVQGLLVYLVVQPGHAFSRDVLATLFWPDEPDSTAKTNFRQTLYQLRKLLESDADATRPFFTVTRQTVQFNPDSDHDCDVTSFLQALKVGDLATAVTLYQGELLPGFACDSLDFEDWLRRERQRLHGLALDALQQRTDWLLGSGSLAEAKALARRQLALEPWRELAHRQLMQAHALDGDRHAALAQFESCQAVLWEELAVAPEPETAALAAKIEAGEEISLQSRPRHNLIAPVTAYFGREADLAAVQDRITNRDYRLVTLVGEGGIGKSRLALEVAWQLREQFADGVWFVPLVGLEARSSLPDAIATAVAQALDYPLAGQQSPRDQLLAFLRERQLLLVLDNFEQLLDGAQLVLDMLHQAPGVCVICTSREPLNFQAEWVLPLERLPLPPIADPFLNTTAVPQEPTTFPAVQLFVDRAQRADGRFQLTDDNQADIVTLCRLLVGLPLALELAAAALRHQTIAQLTAAVGHSIDALATRRHDIPPRHRSMRAVFESAWAQLAPAEQAQLASLSVFLGPFSLRSAESVTGATLYELQTLVEKSLLQMQGDRFVLHALLRQFAAEKLADFPENEAAVQHSHYYLQAVADLGGALNGEMPHLAVQRIARAWENVKGAWETAVSRQDFAPILDALIPLSDFCQIRGLYRDGLRLFDLATDQLQTVDLPDVLAQLLAQRAAMLVRLSQYAQAIQAIKEAMPMRADNWLMARLHITWGEALWRQGKLAEGEEKLRAALRFVEAISDQTLLGIIKFHLGVVNDLQGKPQKSLTFLEEALAIWQATGNLRLQGFTHNSIGLVARKLSQAERAKSSLEHALRISQANDDRQAQASSLNNLSMLATEQGQFITAKSYLVRALALAKTAGDVERQARLNHNLAWNAQQAGWFEEAQTFAERALATFWQVGNRKEAENVRQLLGELAAANAKKGVAMKPHPEQTQDDLD